MDACLHALEVFGRQSKLRSLGIVRTQGLVAAVECIAARLGNAFRHAHDQHRRPGLRDRHVLRAGVKIGGEREGVRQVPFQNDVNASQRMVLPFEL